MDILASIGWGLSDREVRPREGKFPKVGILGNSFLIFGFWETSRLGVAGQEKGVWNATP